MADTASRQVIRRLLTHGVFDLMKGTEPHTVWATDEKGFRIPWRDKIHLKRAERRKQARAFAAGEWRRREK